MARWCLFAHHSANQPQRQQLRGAALRTWAEEAVTLSQRSANTELSVLNRDRRASTGSLSHCVMFKSVISQTTSADNLILCSMAGREPAPESFPLNKRDNIKEYKKKKLKVIKLNIIYFDISILFWSQKRIEKSFSVKRRTTRISKISVNAYVLF